MEQITLGQVAVAVAFLVGLISGFAFLFDRMKKWLKLAFRDDFERLEKRMDSIELEACKNFLVRSFAELEHGGTLDEVNVQRVYECYESYIARGGNSYIKRKMEQLQSEGKL